MREILFRGKQTDKDKWVYGVPAKGNRYDESEIFMIERVFDCDEYACKGCEFTPVIPETVGQYTGLTDKNGERIFEGDIVTACNAMGECTHTATAVKWNDFFAEWSIGKCNSMYSDGSICSYEVIGNIHDNPELIGGGLDA